MENISKATQVETAMQMVIMDAMEKGHTNMNDLISYMKSETFQNAVTRYLEMMA